MPLYVSTVGSAQITDASIVAADIATGAVTSTGILDGTITSADLDGTTTRSPNVLPSDHGILSWSFDVTGGTATQIIGVAGTVYVIRIPIRVATTVTNILMYCSTAGSSLTSGQNFAALFDGSGNLLSATADQTTPWQSTGMKTMALSVAQPISAGASVYAAVFANGSTLPTFVRGANQAGTLANVGLTTTIGSARFATADTGRTTSMPSTLGALTLTGICYWVGLS